jgi:hypothetical protein
MVDAAVGLVTASGDPNCKIIPADSSPTLSLTIEAGATPKDTSHKIIPVANSVDESQTKSGKSGGTTIQPTNNDRDVAAGATSVDTTTKSNAVSSSSAVGGGVDVTKSANNI